MRIPHPSPHPPSDPGPPVGAAAVLTHRLLYLQPRPLAGGGPGGEGKACDGAEKSWDLGRGAGLGASSRITEGPGGVAPRGRELVAYLTCLCMVRGVQLPWRVCRRGVAVEGTDYISVHRKQNEKRGNYQLQE